MANFFFTKLRFLNVNYFKNCKIKAGEVVLQLRFARQILALFSRWLVMENDGIGHVPIKCLKTWSWATFFFRNLFFIAILRWPFFCLKFWHFYQLLSLDVLQLPCFRQILIRIQAKVIVFIEMGEYENSSSFKSW